MYMTGHADPQPMPRAPRTGTGDPIGHAIRYHRDHPLQDEDRADGTATSCALGTEQGIFDHVARAVLAQDARAPDSLQLEHREILTGDGLTSAYRCGRYRSPIGFLVTDAAYGADLELLHLYSRDADGRYPLVDALDPRISRERGTISLIWMLQMAHDNPRTNSDVRGWRSKWKVAMARTATTLGLDASSLDSPWGDAAAA